MATCLDAWVVSKRVEKQSLVKSFPNRGGKQETLYQNCTKCYQVNDLHQSPPFQTTHLPNAKKNETHLRGPKVGAPIRQS